MVDYEERFRAAFLLREKERERDFRAASVSQDSGRERKGRYTSCDEFVALVFYLRDMPYFCCLGCLAFSLKGISCILLKLGAPYRWSPDQKQSLGHRKPTQKEVSQHP